MPYIKQEQRKQFDSAIHTIVVIIKCAPAGQMAGMLNYVITKIIVSLWMQFRRYRTANSIVGVLECVSREFTRRHVNKYEDEKIEQNGDIKTI